MFKTFPRASLPKADVAFPHLVSRPLHNRNPESPFPSPQPSSHQLLNPVQHQVDELLSNGIVASGTLAGSIFLACDEQLWMEKLVVCAHLNFICNEQSFRRPPLAAWFPEPQGTQKGWGVQAPSSTLEELHSGYCIALDCKCSSMKKKRMWRDLETLELSDSGSADLEF